MSSSAAASRLKWQPADAVAWGSPAIIKREHLSGGLIKAHSGQLGMLAKKISAWDRREIHPLCTPSTGNGGVPLDSWISISQVGCHCCWLNRHLSKAGLEKKCIPFQYTQKHTFATGKNACKQFKVKTCMLTQKAYDLAVHKLRNLLRSCLLHTGCATQHTTDDVCGDFQLNSQSYTSCLTAEQDLSLHGLELGSYFYQVNFFLARRT